MRIISCGIIIFIKTLYMRLLFTVLLSCVFFACSSNQSKKETVNQYEVQKESLASIEQKNPSRFVKVTLKKRKNIVGQTVVKGTIHNVAHVVTYKDIAIKLRFYSKTGTLLEEDSDTIYETVAPGKSTDFKLKYFAPKDTDSLAVEVISASSISEAS